MQIEYENYVVEAAQHPCPICGHTVFEWGIISRFTPMTYRRGFAMFRMDNHMGVKARHCLTCDHLQLFVDEALSAEQQRGARLFWLLAFVAVAIAAGFVASWLAG